MTNGLLVAGFFFNIGLRQRMKARVFHLFIALCTVRLNYIHLSIERAAIATAVIVVSDKITKELPNECKFDRKREKI